MNKGYIKLWRKSKDSGFLGNAEVWQLLSWCLLSATHKPHKQLVGKQLVSLEPGQLVFGRKAVAQELNSTEKKIRTCLDLLKNADFLTIKATNKFSIITVVNWHSYQDEGPTKGQQDGQQVGQQEANKGPTKGHKQECKTQSTREDLRESSLRSDSSCPGSSEPDEQKTIHPEILQGEQKPKKLAKQKPEFEEDSEPYRLAVFMRNELKASLPTLKEPDLQKWAHEFDVALRNDQRMKDARFVAQVVRWVVQDSFWRGNCQSPTKLREKFDQLTAKMEAEASRARASPTRLNYAQQRVEQNQEAGRRAKEMLFGNKEQAHAGM